MQYRYYADITAKASRVYGRLNVLFLFFIYIFYFFFFSRKNLIWRCQRKAIFHFSRTVQSSSPVKFFFSLFCSSFFIPLFILRATYVTLYKPPTNPPISRCMHTDMSFVVDHLDITELTKTRLVDVEEEKKGKKKKNIFCNVPCNLSGFCRSYPREIYYIHTFYEYIMMSYNIIFTLEMNFLLLFFFFL